MDRPRPLSPTEAFEAVQRLLDHDDAVSWSSHARQRARERNFTMDDVHHHVLRHGVVSANPEWDDRFHNWKDKVVGRDCDNAPLAIVVAIEPEFRRLVVITGMDA